MAINLYNTTLMVFVILLIWIPWLWRYKVKPCIANRELHQALKKNPHWNDLIKTERFLWELYKGFPAGVISKRERKRLGIEDDAFVYGEIEFLPFYAILNKVKPQASDIFYDLGSGSGKAVFVAASFFGLSKAYGIELLPELCSMARSQISKARDLAATYAQKIAEIDFIQDDFLNHDISKGDIIFINATCLSHPSWEKILNKLFLLKKGSRVIVTSKKIQHDSFKMIDQSVELMSWGMNSVNIYQKIM